MLKQFVALVGCIVLRGQLFAVPDNAIFMSRLKVTGVQGFNPGQDIVKFTAHTSGGWEYLMAHSSSSSGDILKDSLDGIVIKGFDPGMAIESFTTCGPIDGWVSLIAYAGIQSDTILKTKWRGTWVQGYSDGSNVVKGFIADGSGDSVWLEVVMEPAGIEEDSNCQLSISNYQLAIYPNPFTQKTVIQYAVSSKQYGENSKKLPTAYSLLPTICIYDLSGRLVKTLMSGQGTRPTQGGTRPTQGDELTSVVEWDGKDDYGKSLPAGAYYCMLKVGDKDRKQLTKKLIIFKAKP